MSNEPEIEITATQAEAIARGLLAVARADNAMHEREAALIGQFFAGVSAHPSDLGALERAPKIEPAHLAQQLPSAELRVLFVKTALLLAYTDNTYGANEAKVIGDYAAACGLSAQQVSELEVEAKEFLLGQLTHLANVDGVVQVAREFGK